MGAIGSVSGKIEASAAIPNQAMCGSEPSQMVQPGSSRSSEANCNSKQVPWGKNPTARWGFSYGSGVAPPTGDTWNGDPTARVFALRTRAMKSPTAPLAPRTIVNFCRSYAAGVGFGLQCPIVVEDASLPSIFPAFCRPKPPPLPVRCRATGVSLGGLLRRFAKDSELGGLRRDFGPIAVNFMRAYNCQIVSSPPLLRCEAGSER